MGNIYFPEREGERQRERQQLASFMQIGENLSRLSQGLVEDT